MSNRSDIKLMAASILGGMIAAAPSYASALSHADNMEWAITKAMQLSKLVDDECGADEMSSDDRLSAINKELHS